MNEELLKSLVRAIAAFEEMAVLGKTGDAKAACDLIASVSSNALYNAFQQRPDLLRALG